MSDQTVLVTGIAGFIGQALLPLLDQDPGVGRIIGVDRRPLTDPAPPKLDQYQMDIRDPDLEKLLAGVDVLVHLAFVLMRRPGDTPAALDAINIAAPRAVWAAAVRQGVRKLVFTSSVVAYGLHPDNPIPLTEQSPLRPNAGLYYSRAKAAVEHDLDRLAAEHPDRVVTRLRPCTVVGPGADPAQMASLIAPTLPLVSGHDPPIQLLHQDDLARALHLVIQRDAPGPYNATSDEPQTLGHLTRARGARTITLPHAIVRGLMALLWRTGRSNFAPEWVDLSRYSLVASNHRLKELGWQPRYTTPQALAALLAAGQE